MFFKHAMTIDESSPSSGRARNTKNKTNGIHLSNLRKNLITVNDKPIVVKVSPS